MVEGEKKGSVDLIGPPRVLLIDLGAHFGGVENYLVSLAGSSSRRGGVARSLRLAGVGNAA